MVRQFGTVRAAKLLVLLALSRDGKLRREQVAELLWPDDFYDATRLRLRQETHRLKKVLGPAEGLVTSTHTEICLARQGFDTDLDQLRRQIQADSVDAFQNLGSSSWLTGEFLPGWDDPWAVAERAQADQIQLTAAIAMGEAYIAGHRPQAALDLARLIIRRHPTDEGIRLIAVRAHAELGSMTNAVAEYQDLRRQLKDRLGAEPSPDTDTAFKAVVKGKIKPNHRSEKLTMDVPCPIDRLVGRDALLAQVISEISPPALGRLVTLVGPGGIGKTRLAIEAALRLKEMGNRQVAFVTLEEVPINQWVRAVVNRLGSQAPTDADPMSYLARMLRGERLILVLDNLEHLIPEIAGEIRKLLEAVPDLKLLVTSRCPLKLGGEVCIGLSTLDPLVHGRAMLVDALRSFRPRAAEISEQDLALDELAIRLDGYPLAIRLASARFRTLTPKALLQQLKQHPEILSLSGSQGPDRHASLEKALAWSLDSLDSVERAAIDLIAGFPGGVGLELGSFALGANHAVEILERLLDTAMLQLDDRGTHIRFRMLVPVREYVRSTLSDSRWHAVQDHCAQATVSFVKSLAVGPHEPLTESKLLALDDDHENLESAMLWLVDQAPLAAVDLLHRLWPYENLRARHRQTLNLIQRLEPTWLCADDASRVSMQLAKTVMLASLAQEQEALPGLEDAEQRVQNINDPTAEVLTAFVRAYWMMRRDFLNSREAAERAVEVANKLDNVFLKARAQHLAGMVSYYTNDISATIENLRSAYQMFQDVGELAYAGTCGLMLCGALSQANRGSETTQILEESRRKLQIAGDPARMAFLYETEGRIALDAGNAEIAEASFRKSLEIWEFIGSAYQRADQLLSITRALLAQSRFQDAKQTLTESADLWVQDDNYGGLSQSVTCVACILFSEGQAELAARTLAAVLAFEREQNVKIIQPEVDFRNRIIDKVGLLPPFEGTITVADVRQLFNLLQGPIDGD